MRDTNARVRDTVPLTPGVLGHLCCYVKQVLGGVVHHIQPACLLDCLPSGIHHFVERDALDGLNETASTVMLRAGVQVGSGGQLRCMS